MNFFILWGIAWQKGGKCMDQPNCPDRGADSNFSFLVAVLAAALLALQALYREEAGQESGLFPLRLGESVLTLGSSGFFLTQSLQELSQADPKDPLEVRWAQRSLVAAILVFIAALLQFQSVQEQRARELASEEPLTS